MGKIIKLFVFFILFNVFVCFLTAKDMKIATAFNKGSESYLIAEKFSQLVDHYTNGGIKVQFISGSSIGSEQDQMQMLINNSIDATVNGTLPIQNFAKEYSFMASPFVLKDYDHFKRIWKSSLGNQIRASLVKNNINAIGVYYRGLRHFTSNKPLKNASDFKGLKLRITPSPIYDRIYKSLGANIVQIGLPELYASLKNGIADASDGPASQLNSYRLNEVQKYLILSGHQVAVGLICINDSFYKKLSDSEKKAVEKAAVEALAAGDDFTMKSEKELIDKLTKAGMTVIKPDLDSIRNTSKKAIDDLFKEQWNVTTWDAVNKM